MPAREGGKQYHQPHGRIKRQLSDPIATQDAGLKTGQPDELLEEAGSRNISETPHGPKGESRSHAKEQLKPPAPIKRRTATRHGVQKRCDW